MYLSIAAREGTVADLQAVWAVRPVRGSDIDAAVLARAAFGNGQKATACFTVSKARIGKDELKQGVAAVFKICKSGVGFSIGFIAGRFGFKNITCKAAMSRKRIDPYSCERSRPTAT